MSALARALMRAGHGALLAPARRCATSPACLGRQRAPVAMLLTASGDPLLVCRRSRKARSTRCCGCRPASGWRSTRTMPWSRGDGGVGAQPALTRRLASTPPARAWTRPRSWMRPPSSTAARAQVPAELALMQACDMTLEVQRLAGAREGMAPTSWCASSTGAPRAQPTTGRPSASSSSATPPRTRTHPGVQHLREATGADRHRLHGRGYHADITRTGVRRASDDRSGSGSEHAAQAAAFAAVRPGVACEDVDAAARRVLEAAGLGPDYRLPGLPHRTGHGCGLAIHEAPYLVRGNRSALEPGMCASNEPMIVVPGRFGVRLEDLPRHRGGRALVHPSIAGDRPAVRMTPADMDVAPIQPSIRCCTQPGDPCRNKASSARPSA